MSTIKNNALIITIQTSDPKEERELLTKAIATAIRWYSSSDATYQDDKNALYRLAQLQERIVSTE